MNELFICVNSFVVPYEPKLIKKKAFFGSRSKLHDWRWVNSFPDNMNIVPEVNLIANIVFITEIEHKLLLT